MGPNETVLASRNFKDLIFFRADSKMWPIPRVGIQEQRLALRMIMMREAAPSFFACGMLGNTLTAIGLPPGAGR